MKNKILFLFGAATLLLLSGCKDTWLMYDPAQKDHLYFEISSISQQASFALLEDDQMQYNISVKMMGMPVDVDRKFEIEYLEIKPGEKVTVGSSVIEVVKAREKIDFEISDFMMPAGKTEHVISLILHRQEVMKNKFAAVRFCVVENEEFLPLAADSTNLKKIKSPIFNLFVGDGDPVCPDWWDASGGGQDLSGWSMYSGRFHAEKFRKFLELYREIENKNPVLYRAFVEKYGENLDKEGIVKSFFAVENAAAWASYVLIPLFEYYKVYYSEHPEDPNIETMATSGTAGTYWRDPISLLR